MKNIQTITCAADGCTNTFDWEILPGHGSPTDLLCDPCEEKREIERKAASEALKAESAAITLRSTLSALEAAIPERYRATRLDHPEFNLNLWESVRGWGPTEERPWIGIVGSGSGECKTRIAVLLLRDLIATGSFSDFEVAVSYDVKRWSLAQYGDRDPGSKSPRAHLDRLAECGILILDDIGKSKHTPAVAEELFSIIDRRYARVLPIIWTSNCHPTEFLADIGDKELAGPMLGRILECSTIIDLDS